MKKIVNSLLIIALFICSLFLGKLVFHLIMTLIAIISLREILHIRIKDSKHLPIEIELLSYVIIAFFVMNNYSENLSFYLVDYKLLAALILMDLIPLVLIDDKKKYNLLDSLYLIGSTLFIGITFNLLTQFRSYNINYVAYIFLIAGVYELFSFITDKYIGKNRFLPTIAFNKTYEGVIGGIIMSSIISTMFLISTVTCRLPVYAIFVLTVFLSVLGVLGDLVFSFIKKEFNKKEFSNYFIINGGILDIVDSVVFITLGFILIESII